MSTQTKYKVTFVTKIALLIAAFWTMADMFVVTPILETISRAYPTASGLAVNLCYCLSQGTVILGSLFVASMSTKMVKKNMMLLGGTLILIFGGFGGLVPGIPLMLIFRGIEGFGAGICITLIPTLIDELFTDEKEKNTLLGVQAGVGCVCGALCAFLSGTIAENIGWKQSYFLYFFSIIIIILIIIGVPKTDLDKPAPKGAPVKLNAASWELFVMAIFFGIFSSALFAYVSYIVVETGLGSAKVAGSMASVIQVGSFVGSIAMAAVYAKVKAYTDTVGWGAMCIGGLIFMIAAVNVHSIILAAVGCALFGISNGLLFPYLYAKAAIVCAPGTNGKTMSATTIGYYIGMFGAIFFYEAFMAVLHTSSKACVYFMIAGSAIYLVISVIQGVKNHGVLKPGNPEASEE